MSETDYRITKLDLKDVQLGVFISPITGLYHICRDDKWLHEESEAVLEYRFFEYGVILVLENGSYLILNDGKYFSSSGSCYIGDKGVIMDNGESESFLGLPEKKNLSKDGSFLFNSLFFTDDGIIAENKNETFSYFSFSKDNWISLNESDEFDKILDCDDYLLFHRDGKVYLYLVEKEIFWSPGLEIKGFDEISVLNQGIRIKENRKYKLYSHER